MRLSELLEQLQALDAKQLRQNVVVMDSDGQRLEVSTFGDDVDAADRDYEPEQLYLFYD